MQFISLHKLPRNKKQLMSEPIMHATSKYDPCRTRIPVGGLYANAKKELLLELLVST